MSAHSASSVKVFVLLYVSICLQLIFLSFKTNYIFKCKWAINKKNNDIYFSLAKTMFKHPLSIV